MLLVVLERRVNRGSKGGWVFVPADGDDDNGCCCGCCCGSCSFSSRCVAASGDRMLAAGEDGWADMVGSMGSGGAGGRASSLLMRKRSGCTFNVRLDAGS